MSTCASSQIRAKMRPALWRLQRACLSSALARSVIHCLGAPSQAAGTFTSTTPGRPHARGATSWTRASWPHAPSLPARPAPSSHPRAAGVRVRPSAARSVLSAASPVCQACEACTLCGCSHCTRMQSACCRGACACRCPRNSWCHFCCRASLQLWEQRAEAAS